MKDLIIKLELSIDEVNLIITSLMDANSTWKVIDPLIKKVQQQGMAQLKEAETKEEPVEPEVSPAKKIKPKK
jgi:hypothetical protein